MLEKERLFCPGEQWGGGRGFSETYPFKKALRKTCEVERGTKENVLKIQASYIENVSVVILMAETLGQILVLAKQFRFFEAYSCRRTDKGIRKGVLCRTTILFMNQAQSPQRKLNQDDLGQAVIS